MKIDKNELAKKIGQLKGIVPSKTTSEALRGVLYKDGYLIASNTELTVKAKLEAEESNPDDRFIIPEKAFDLISNMPNGIIELIPTEGQLTIKMDKIKNVYNTVSPDEYTYQRNGILSDKMSIVSADKLRNAINHTLYATAITDPRVEMTGICFECSNGKLEFVGLDGHRVAYDCIQCEGEFKFIIPRLALNMIMKLDMENDISITYDDYAALFKCSDYEVYARLISGEYFRWRAMMKDGPITFTVDRKVFLEAINRVRLCSTEKDKAPVLMEIQDNRIHISFKNSATDYEEDVSLQMSISEQIKIGFNPKLLIESLKSFECENIVINMTGPKAPVTIKADNSEMKALVLPVSIR